MNLRRLTSGMILVVLLAVGVVACGGGGGSHASSPRSLAPGHESPEAALAGFMTAAAQNEGSNACVYAQPSQASECNQAFTTTAVSVRKWNLGNSLVFGDQALVVLVADKFCAGESCSSNSDPNKDLPRDQNDFPAAFSRAQEPSKSPAVPCVRVNGQWYVIMS